MYNYDEYVVRRGDAKEGNASNSETNLVDVKQKIARRNLAFLLKVVRQCASLFQYRMQAPGQY